MFTPQLLILAIIEVISQALPHTPFFVVPFHRRE